MSQAIKLPHDIRNIVETGEKGKVMPHLEGYIENYAREVALVAAILGDNYMKSLYEAQGTGYIAALDTLYEWAAECVKRYAHVEEWEEFMDSEENPYKSRGAMCWDDYVIMFGEDKMKENRYTIKEA